MQLRTHVILAVFKRNFFSYFSGVIGYLFIVVFVGACASFAFSPEFFANNLANLDQLNQYFPLLLLFIVPAVTMGSWADERKQGTDELLFTLPATDFEILLGKYLAVLAIYTAALLFSLVFCAFGVLAILTTTAGSWVDFDMGLILTNYFGYWIAGAALLSAGMLASILTSSVTVAFIVGVLICAIPVAVSHSGAVILFLQSLGLSQKFFQRLGLSEQLFQSFGLSEQLRDFGLGMIPFSGILYFISLTIFMLYLNIVMISKRHWSGGPQGVPMGMHFLVRALSLAVILISFNVVAAAGSRRVDMTSEHIYSVFPTTRETLKQINPERPVLIQAFISPNVPGDYVSTRSNLIGLLRQYDQLAGNRLRVRIVETEQYTDAADEAKKFGIQPQQVSSQRGGKAYAEAIYMGAISSGADDEVVIPFFDVGTPVEYELTRSVRTVSQNKRLRVGILTTDAKLAGGFDQTTFSSSPEWRIVTELKKQYDVDQVVPDGPIVGQYDVLIAAMPSSLTDPQLTNLVDYIKQGKPALIFDDPLPYFTVDRGFSLAPRRPKPTGGGMFGQQQPPVPKADNGKATRLLKELGIFWDNGEVVWDLYNPHLEYADVWPQEFVFVDSKSPSKNAFSSSSAISSGLQEMVVLYGGTIRPGEGNNLTFTALLRSSPRSGVLSWDELVEDTPAFFGMGGARLKNDPTRVIDDVEHVLAAHITSKKKDDQPGINVVFAADLDMIHDIMFRVRDHGPSNLKLDNVTFVLNAVDVLAGEQSLVEIRKRRARHRTLTRVENLTAEYVKTRTVEREKADADAKKALEDAKKRLGEKSQEIKANENLDPRTKDIMLNTVQAEEQRRLLVREAEIENERQKKNEASKATSEREIRRVETNIRYAAIFLPPIPVLLLGLAVFFSGLAAERRSIIPDRLIQHHPSKK